MLAEPLKSQTTETEERNIQVKVEVYEQDCEIHHSLVEDERFLAPKIL